MAHSILSWRLYMAGFMLVAVSMFANAQVPDTVLSTEDTYSFLQTPTTVMGTDVVLRVRAPLVTGTDQTLFRKTYLKFNLSTYAKTIGSAKLRLGIERAVGSAGKDQANLYQVSDDSWTAATLTWNTAPTNGNKILSQVFFPRSSTLPDTAYYLDVTNYVKAEYAGDKIVSFCLQDDSASGTDLRLISSRHTVKPTSQKPALVLSSSATGVEEEIAMVPDQFELQQNFPNPFNPETRIAYSLPTGGYIRAAVYNMLGTEVRSLADGVQSAGYHQMVWDARANDGRSMPSGLYFCTIQASGTSKTIKMLLVR
jgi:hypothetical protein